MTDTTTPAPLGAPTNGDLPAVRESLVAQAERVHQEMMHERDMLRKQLAERDTEISGLKAQLSVSELEASQLRNRADNSVAIVNEAIARRAAVEAVLASMMAIGRAFQIENTPLVRETPEEAYAENLSRDPAPDHSDGHGSDGGRK